MNVALIDPSISPIMAARDRVRAMERSHPLLALAYLVEAMGNDRIRCDVTATAQLAELAYEAKRAVEKVTGKPFSNPLYRE